MAWIRFNDVSAEPAAFGRRQMNFAISSQSDGNLFQPWCGMTGGYQFGSGGPQHAAYAADATQWHHYAQSWDQATGARHIYLDGVEQVQPSAAGTGVSFLDEDAYIVIGSNCYPTNWLTDDYVQCNMQHTFDGEIDDIAVWAGELSPAEILDVWSLQGEDMLGQGPSGSIDGIARSSPVFLWTFDEPLLDTSGPVDKPYVENKGTANVAAYDMVLGRMPKDEDIAAFGYKLYDVGSSTAFDLSAPALIPTVYRGARTSADADSSAPYVTAAAASEAVTLTVGANGVDFTATMPSTFAATYVGTGTDAQSNSVAVHVLPTVRIRPPRAPPPPPLTLPPRHRRPLPSACCRTRPV
jgi:hypothetical protein